MLLGRETEQRELERVMAEARLGRSGVLAVVGEPGIGKTALLDAVAQHAEGMRLLRARGVESEAGVAFGGLLELLRPALGSLDRIPGPQAAALGGALALQPGSAGDRFAVGAATLSLLAAYAEEAPLLVVVDDVHWLDVASAEALLFAVRRLLVDPIAVVLAVRSGVQSVLDGAELPTMALGGLDRDAATALLAQGADAPLAAGLADRLLEATAGNPLALMELSDAGPDLAVVGAARPAPISERLTAAFGRSAAALGEPARRALVLAATAGGGDLAVLGHAADELGFSVASLGEAEAAGLVSLAGATAEFRHPLVRSAVYDSAAPDELRAAHRALATALPEGDIDRRAWHLAAAAIGPDQHAADALCRAAERAYGRRAYAVAAAAWERAARLAPDDHDRAELLHDAAEAAWRAGASDRAERLAGEVAEQAPGPVLAARAEALRGRVVGRRGPLMDGYAILMAAADRAAEAGEPELAVEILAEAVAIGFWAGDAGAMMRSSERADALLPEQPGARAEFLALTSRGIALIWSGETEDGTRHLRHATELFEASEALQRDASLHSWALIPPLWLRDAATGRELADGMLAAAQGQAALGALPVLWNYAARDHATSDRWGRAIAGYDESIRLARELGQWSDLAGSLAGLAWVEARQGREEACRAHAGEARELCARIGVVTHDMWAIAALADLEMGFGRAAPALEILLGWQARLDSLELVDVDLSPGADLVEAHLRLGQEAEATAALEAYDAQAREKGRPWALARAARCHGMLAGDSEFDDHFAEALRLHSETPDGFEAARTKLAHGTRLRRARRRADAREPLREAFEAFERIGAAPWAEQAVTELAATGETARRRDPSTLDDLTPQELRIAQLLAEGRTTRQAAAALFLSPKTIEYHLRHVYNKLGVRSRPELAEALAARDWPGPADVVALGEVHTEVDQRA